MSSHLSANVKPAVVSYHPSIWGNPFLYYTPDDEVIIYMQAYIIGYQQSKAPFATWTVLGKEKIIWKMIFLCLVSKSKFYISLHNKDKQIK